MEDKYPENVIVEELENFNKIGQETYELLEDTGRHILRSIACYLDLEETYFDKHIFNGNSILRAIHYPPITEEPKKAERAAAHGDINLITLLMGAHGRGLHAKRKSPFPHPKSNKESFFFKRLEIKFIFFFVIK